MIRIFIPQKLSHSSESVFLIGWHNCHENIPFRSVFVWSSSKSILTLHDPRYAVIGKLNVGNAENADNHCEPHPGKGELHINLEVTGEHFIYVTRVLIGGKTKPIATHACTVVLFDPEQFKYLNELVLNLHSAQSFDPQRCSKEENVPEICNDISLLHSSLNEFRQQSPSKLSKLDVIDFSNNCESFPFKLCRLASLKCLLIMIFFSNFVCNFVIMSGLNKIIDKTARYLNFSLQLKTRLLQLSYLQKSSSTGFNDLRCWNTAAVVFVDVLLGFLLTGVLLKLASVDALLDEFLFLTNFIVDNLYYLLNWLMGVPAGLKLNYALNHSMGTFFLFHIYLWQAYLYVMKPALQFMLDISLFCGVFGLSCQLCVIQDLLSFATFHIYCFYAYAARIYNINFVSLISLWRVFRGKKWNPLRQRIDSCLYDVDQLFMGTLCFTIFLFLLPTALMYYVVFLTLRLNVLIIQGIIQKTIALVNTFPLYTLVLFSLNSRSLIANFRFTVIPTKDYEKPTNLKMTGELCSLIIAVTGFSPPSSIKERQLTWKAFLIYLLTGRLIYPI